jgi:hypothetical protein
MLISEFDHERETGKEYKSQDYYAGYYWGNNAYDSNELAGRINDEELKNRILEDLKNNTMKSHMTIIDYIQQLLNTHVVVKVLNDLQVTEPESWSNQGLINEGELISE